MGNAMYAFQPDLPFVEDFMKQPENKNTNNHQTLASSTHQTIQEVAQSTHEILSFYTVLNGCETDNLIVEDWKIKQIFFTKNQQKFCIKLDSYIHQVHQYENTWARYNTDEEKYIVSVKVDYIWMHQPWVNEHERGILVVWMNSDLSEHNLDAHSLHEYVERVIQNFHR